MHATQKRGAFPVRTSILIIIYVFITSQSLFTYISYGCIWQQTFVLSNCGPLLLKMVVHCELYLCNTRYTGRSSSYMAISVNSIQYTVIITVLIVKIGRGLNPRLSANGSDALPLNYLDWLLFQTSIVMCVSVWLNFPTKFYSSLIVKLIIFN